MHYTVAFSEPMLDTRFKIHDAGFKIQEPAIRNKDPGSVNTCNGFHPMDKFDYSILCSYKV
jgi:hypothetical protein